MNRLRDRFNRYLDHIVRPEIRLFRHSCPAFKVFIYLGAVLAVGSAFSLVSYQGLSPGVMGGIVAAVAVALLLAVAVDHAFPNYHMQATVVTAAATFLWLTGQPVLPYLDGVACALGLAVGSGRIGCLMVGCCHGRPHRWGICYRPEHADVGFPPHLVGVRLIPIQLVESAWVLINVIFAMGLVFRGAAPGTALAWYVIAYGLGRFAFEFLRGDPSRSCWGGLSEAQWTSGLLLLLLVAAELTGVVPLHGSHLAAACGLALVVVARPLRRWTGFEPRRLSGARHMNEVASALRHLDTLSQARATGPGRPNGRPVVDVAETSLGIRISAGRSRFEGGTLEHFTLSRHPDGLCPRDAGALADLIFLLRRPESHGKLTARAGGVYHLVVSLPSGGSDGELNLRAQRHPSAALAPVGENEAIGAEAEAVYPAPTGAGAGGADTA